jgi:hypothetical protein
MKINFFREIVANYIINDVINEKFAFQKNKNSDKTFLEYFKEIAQNYIEENGAENLAIDVELFCENRNETVKSFFEKIWEEKNLENFEYWWEKADDAVLENYYILKIFENRLKKYNKKITDKIEQKILICFVYDALSDFENSKKNDLLMDYDFEILLEQYNEFKLLFEKMDKKFYDISDLITESTISSILEIENFEYNKENIRNEIEFFCPPQDLPEVWIENIVEDIFKNRHYY